MEVNLQNQDDGCRNADLLNAHAQKVNRIEAYYAKKRDTTVTPGTIACTGCFFTENLGRVCSAEMEPTIVTRNGRQIGDNDLSPHIPNFRAIEPDENDISRP